MTAPTLLDYAESTWTGVSTGSEVTDDLDWNASGDRVVVLGCTEDNSRLLSTPTATGLTFAALTGLPTNSASSCRAYGWEATAGGNGNSAITAASDGSSAARGISAWAFSGSSGLGTPVVAVSAALTVNVTTSADSSVVMVLGDWNATTDVAVTTVPTGGTIREATNVSGVATFLVVEWHNQAVGTRAYGVSAWTGTGTISKAAVEVLGTAGGGPIIGNVTRVAETATARPVSARKSYALGRVTVTEVARPLSAGRAYAVARASETASARPASRQKAVQVGRVVTSEAARTLTRTKTHPAINRVAETVTARPVGRLKTYPALGRVSETVTARSAARIKTYACARVAETATAAALTADGTIVGNLTRVTVTEIARPVGKAKTTALARILTTETARSLTRTKVRGLNRVASTETARAVLHNKLKTINRVQEIASARTAIAFKRQAAGRVLETASARTLTATGPSPEPEGGQVWGVDMGLR